MRRPKRHRSKGYQKKLRRWINGAKSPWIVWSRQTVASMCEQMGMDSMKLLTKQLNGDRTIKHCSPGNPISGS